MSGSILMKLFTAITLLMCSSLINAQSFSIAWSEKMGIKYEFDDAVPLEGGKTLVLKLDNKMKLTLSRAKPTLILSSASTGTLKEQVLDIEENDPAIKGFEKFGQNIFLIYSAYNSGDKTTSMYALKLNSNELTVSSKILLSTYQSQKRNAFHDIVFKVSSDSSKVMIFMEDGDRKKENEKFYINVFNTDLKQLWKKTAELKTPAKMIFIYDQNIADDGTVLVAIQHFDKGVERQAMRENGEDVPAYNYKIHVYSGDDKEREIVVDLKNNFVHGTKLYYNKDGSITVAGLYKKKYNGEITGLFYGSVDVGNTVITDLLLSTFPEDLIDQLDRDRFGSNRKADPGLEPYFKIDYIIHMPDGTTNLISEYNYLAHLKEYNDMYHSPGDQYYSGDIINTNISKNGKVIFTRVPKDQRLEGGDLFLGYFPVLYKGKLMLLYNDDKDNIDRDVDKKPDDISNFKKSVLVAAVIDAKGNLSRKAVYINGEEDYIIVPRNFAKISESKFLVTGDLMKMFRRGTRYGVLTIQ